MRRKTFQVRILRRLIIALILVLCLVSINSSPVFALSLDDFFEISYDVEFTKTEIHGGEVSYATVEAKAKCVKDLLLTVSEAQITGRIIAKHQASGAKVTLNPSYTVTIKPFPNKKDDITQARRVVSLQFPGGSEPGSYSVVGELIEAKVNTLLGWLIVPRSYLPPSQAMGSVKYVTPDAGVVGGGSIIIGPDTDLPDYINENGVFTQAITVESADGRCKLTINEGTMGLTQDGEPLSQISIVEMEEPPALPEDSSVIGLVYDIGPDGATFEPPITLTFTYDPALIPEGVAEENLVIAMWDVNAGKWVNLGCTVNTSTYIITAKVAHFTYFTVLAYTSPAAFTATDLVITPEEVNIGDEVTISILVTNTGNLEGTCQVTLEIDNKVVETQEVTLTGGASDTVTFKISKDAAKIYSVNINGLSGSFVVKPVAEPEPVAIPEPAPAPTPTHTSSPAKPINWPVLSGVIAAVVVVGLLIFFLARRRSY